MEKQRVKPLIFGLRRTTLALILALCIAVILLAVIGGGVGVALSKSAGRRHRKQHSEAPSMSMTSISALATSTSSSALPNQSATTLKSPSWTIQRDCPSSNGTVIEVGQATSQKFIKNCSFLYKFTVNASPFEKMTSSLDDCISLCASYNSLNATGPLGPCSSVCWRTNPTDKFFGHCLGQYSTRSGIGQPATDPGADNAPADSALLLS